MRYLLPTGFLSLLLATAIAAAPDALARGGRFRGPSGPGPSGPASAPDGDEMTPSCPAPQPPASRVPSASEANPSAVPSVRIGGRRRVSGRSKAPGLADWFYWYEANREEFEDLRAGLHVTEAHPLFAMGQALGRRVGRVERRLDLAQGEALKRTVLGVLGPKEDEHWVYTEGAAYVALGKIATSDEDVEILTRVFDEKADFSQYVRESAALGLGQLRRTEERRQLPASTLDRVRRLLRNVLVDERRATRTRAFAGVSLGLLADQPSSETDAARRSAERLFEAWWAKELPDEAQVGLLLGLGLHPARAIVASQRTVLQACAVRGALGSRTWSHLVRAQAAVTLGRLGGSTEALLLAKQLQQPTTDSPALLQAMVLAAGSLGSREPGVRGSVVEGITVASRRAKDPATRRMAIMSIGRIAAAAAKERGSLPALVAPALRTAVSAGDDRAFGALATALAVRAVDESLTEDGWQELRGSGLQRLRKGLADRRLDGHSRAAFAVALGIARDARSVPALRAVLDDQDLDPDLRAHAALGLGLVGEMREGVVATLVRALRDTRSDLLRMRAVTAIGLLGGGRAKDRERTVRVLIEQLRRTRNQHVKGRIVITLARIGDARAVAPLVASVKAESETHMDRAMACAALGLMGDEERTPVLSAARRDCHYMAGSDVLFEILDVL